MHKMEVNIAQKYF